jgi:predicted oxidoreductase (fatty acid repression mutant protein)
MCTNSISLSQAIFYRRSIYGIGKDVSLTDEAIEGIIRHSVKAGPSPYNSQSGRAALLLHEHHQKLWDYAIHFYEKTLPEEFAASIKEKLLGFAAGYGTVLFFEDQETVKSLQKRFPKVKDTFPSWSLQASGMLQYSVWISLEEKGLGASLQHYNSVLDRFVKETWDIPGSWELIAQMPFGNITKDPDAKTFLPIEERVKVFK